VAGLWSNLKHISAMARMFVQICSTKYLRTKVRVVPFAYLDVVDRCNSRCRTCDIWRPRPDSPPELTTDEILSLRPALRRLKTQIVSIGGGEPTLRHDLETCIAAFRKDGMSVHINTNALAIDQARARSLAQAGLSVVYVSCDHPDRDGYKAIRGVDGLNRVVAAVEHFRSLPEPIPVGINVVVSRLNQDALEALADRCIKWGVQKLQFIPVHTYLRYREMVQAALEQLTPRREDLPDIKATIGRIASRLQALGIETNSRFYIDHFETAYEFVRPVPCLAGSLFVMINPFGDVFPCYQQQKGLNIRQMPLDAIVRSTEFRAQRRGVVGCNLACWDAGSAEPSIRFHLPYLLRHPIEVYREARMHLG